MAQPAALSLTTLRRKFRHEALFYADEEGFLAGTSSFLREGLDRDEPALVVLSRRKIEALGSELDGDADRVLFADMAEVGANPARIIPAWRDFVDRFGGHGCGLRGIGEPIWPGRTAAELAECQRHESLLNLAFADTPGFQLLCPYDTGSLDDAVIDEARRNHRFLAQDGHTSESDDFRSLEEVSAPFSEPLPDPPAGRDWRTFQSKTLGTLRAWVIGHASRAGLGSDTTEEMALAVHEIAVNSIVHGGGGGICRLWQEGDTLVCEINDKGVIAEPLAGRQLSPFGGRQGYGLWLANQLCDLVQVRALPGGGAVRLHKRSG